MTAVGTWGDCIAAYGNMQRNIEDHGYKQKITVICYTKDPEIVKFLKMQKEIKDVIHLCPKNDEEYLKFVGWAGKKLVDWAANKPVGWHDMANIKEGLVVQTHIGNDYLFDHPDIINRPKQMELDYSLSIRVPDNVLFFQPFSTQSVALVDHWPYWFQALEWLNDRGGWDIWVIGQRRGGMRGKGFEFPDLRHLSNVVSYVDRACMMAVLQIAKHCKGIVTTSNCISMWSIIHNKKTLVMCNKLNLTHDYYNGWIRHPPNTLLPANTTLDKFKRDFEEWESSL